QFHEQAHQRNVRAIGGKEKRRRPLRLDSRRCVGLLRRAFGEAEVDVRASLYDFAHKLQTREAARTRRRRGIAVVARIRLSHPGDRVEWSESRSDIVRVRARVDQRNRKLEMTVLYSEQQGTRAPVDRPD